jgi:hypothetical protein
VRAEGAGLVVVPWENGYRESFKGKLCVELLNHEAFDTLLEAKVLIERWRVEYNGVRPHSAPGYRPPASEAYCPGPAGGLRARHGPPAAGGGARPGDTNIVGGPVRVGKSTLTGRKDRVEKDPHEPQLRHPKDRIPGDILAPKVRHRHVHKQPGNIHS